jgi:hypothetical protein
MILRIAGIIFGPYIFVAKKLFERMKRGRSKDHVSKSILAGKWEFRLHNAPNHDFEVKHTVNDDTSIVFVLQFWPPMPASQAGMAHVELWHQQKQRLVLGAQLLKLKDKVRYIEYETHQLRMDTHNDTIECLYCAVDDQEQLRVHVPLNHPRAKELSWLAPDAPLPKDTRTIPQRSGPWFELRKQKLSGTKAYNYIGYYWERKEPSEYQKSLMRKGTECEPYAILTYLNHFNKRTFQEVGFACAPSPPYPPHWGASPDGLVHDPDMTWEQVPDDYKRHLNVADWDICSGCVEIKTGTKSSLEPYYIVQAYMEMISLQVVWCDLIRYHPTNDTAIVYRIYRHKPTEDRLVTLLKRADAHQNSLGTIIDEPEFVQMRKFLQEDAIPVLSKSAVHIVAPKDLLKNFRQRKLAALEPQPHVEPRKKVGGVENSGEVGGMRGGVLTLCLEQMHKQSVQMLACNDHKKLKLLLLEQISTCSEMLTELERDE